MEHKPKPISDGVVLIMTLHECRRAMNTALPLLMQKHRKAAVELTIAIKSADRILGVK